MELSQSLSELPRGSVASAEKRGERSCVITTTEGLVIHVDHSDARAYTATFPAAEGSVKASEQYDSIHSLLMNKSEGYARTFNQAVASKLEALSQFSRNYDEDDSSSA
jgi:hypothetical protein